MADATLIVVALVYLVALICVGCYAKVQKDRVARKSGALASQFSGSYSTAVLMITTASSIFSGATVVGIPGEVAKYGFTSVRWFLAMATIVASMTILYPRLRRMAVEKGFTGPNDFIFHRYESTPLRALTMLASSVAGVIYLSIQFNAFGGQFSAMTGLSSTVGMIAFGIVVLTMEQIGGLSSVVYTDVLQGVIMVICFVLLPFILWSDYGFFFSIASADCGNLRFFNTSSSEFAEQCVAAPADADCAKVGCIGNTNPSFLAYPEADTMIPVVFWFVFGMLAYPLNLQLLQRCYISKSESSLRTVLLSLLVAAVIAYPSGIYLGIAHSTFKSTFGSEISGHAFFGMMQVFERQGGFRRIFMMVTTCSYLAAVMSTTDSVVMGVSSTVAQDLVKGMLFPGMKQEHMVRAGILVSLIQVVLGAVGGISISPAQYGNVLSISNGFLFQVMPCYVLGLFSSISALPLIVGLVTGMASSLVLSFMFAAPSIPAPFAGLFLNVIVVAISWPVSVKLLNKPESSESTVSKVSTLVALTTGRRLPPFWLPVVAFFICLGTTPIWMGGGSEQPVLGMPVHAWTMLGGASVGGLLSVAALWMWDASSEEIAAGASEQVDVEVPGDFMGAEQGHEEQAEGVQI